VTPAQYTVAETLRYVLHTGVTQ